MLIEFSVRNFRSFKDRITLSLEATALTSRDKELDENTIFAAAGLRLLTSTAIYGANASGKSNLVLALDFMRTFMLQSSKDTQAGEPIRTEPFALSLDTRDQPTEYELIFIVGGRQYRYGFEVSTIRVEREWLYHVPAKTEKLLFERTGQDIRVNPKGFKEGIGLEDKTRDNALFLSVVAQFNGEIATRILLWANRLRIITGISALDTSALALNTIETILEDSSNDIVEFLNGFDTGIHDISLEETENNGSLSQYDNKQLGTKHPISKSTVNYIHSLFGLIGVIGVTGVSELMKNRKSLRPRTTHPVYSSNGDVAGYQNFDLDKHESEGTKKLFAMSALIIQALRDGSVLVIDEFDARLHPKITRGIVQLFNSITTNPHHAQLVFLTHDTNLLDRQLLRRDQIWFVEKDRYSSSHLYSLAELKVRNDASYEHDYITGKYGAIPFIGNLAAIAEEIVDEEQDDAKAAQG